MSLSPANDTMLRRSTNDTTPGMFVLGRKTYLAAAICGLVKKPAYDLFAVTPTADRSLPTPFGPPLLEVLHRFDLPEEKVAQLRALLA